MIAVPGQVAKSFDRDDAVSLIIIALQFCWDLHLVSASGRDAVYISHHEEGWFGSRERTAADEAVARLRDVADPYAA